MSRHRFVPRIFYDTPLVPFGDAEEAWFWFVRCQRARTEGARFEPVPGALTRPCDPDDVYRALQELARRRHLREQHLSVLERFGLIDRPPDPRNREERRPAALWKEALDELATVLRRKGIVE